MKKIITFVMAVVMVLSMSVTALASNGGFVASPSLNGTPSIEGSENGSADCDAEWVITSYADRGKLSAAQKAEIEKCYDIIKNTENIMSLNAGLASVVGDSDAKLAVSDLFDLSYHGCDSHEEHGKTDFTLKADTLKNFKALLCYSNGEWKIVEGASVNGNLLTFSTDTFSIFAIVVDAGTSAGDDVVNTGDSARFLWYGAIMLVSLVGIAAVVGVKARSSKKSER